jgi:hypothetical protein
MVRAPGSRVPICRLSSRVIDERMRRSERSHQRHILRQIQINIDAAMIVGVPIRTVFC